MGRSGLYGFFTPKCECVYGCAPVIQLITDGIEGVGGSGHVTPKWCMWGGRRSYRGIPDVEGRGGGKLSHTRAQRKHANSAQKGRRRDWNAEP